MNKKLLITYILFLSYTLISLTAERSTTLDFMALFTFDGDMLLVMIFNMLGVFPVYYLMVALRYEKQKPYVYVFFALGFMLGAFAVIPGLLLLKGDKKPMSRKKQGIFIALSFILLLMLLTGFIFGDLNAYWRLFLNDQFVHIMTVDLIVLILIPYLDGVRSTPFLHFIKWQS